jgi:glyoxylase-like metal-dependent hydrolase (beta-lactamase superfamily II)
MAGEPHPSLATPHPAVAIPALPDRSWHIGSVVVTRFVERISQFPIADFIPGATPELIRRHADWLGPWGTIDPGVDVSPVCGYLVEAGGLRILVDTCVGLEHSISFPESPFLTRLRQCGCPTNTIDLVVCTHFHFDHVGWNTRVVDDERVPTFTRAQYVFPEAEWDGLSRLPGASAMNRRLHESVDRSVRYLVDRGLAALVSDRHELSPEICLVPTSGHSPGHCSLAIRADGSEAILLADVAHHPLQLAEPSLTTAADYDPAQAVVTRQRLVDHALNHETLLIGTHFAGPGAGYLRVSRDGRVWLEPASTRAGTVSPPAEIGHG